LRIKAISWSSHFKRKNAVQNSIAKILNPTLSVFSNPEPTSPMASSSSVTTSKIVSVSSVTTSEALTPSNRTKFLSKRADLSSTQMFYEQLDQLRFFNTNCSATPFLFHFKLTLFASRLCKNVAPDGNCFYRCLSNIVCGDEKKSSNQLSQLLVRISGNDFSDYHAVMAISTLFWTSVYVYSS